MNEVREAGFGALLGLEKQGKRPKLFSTNWNIIEGTKASLKFPGE